MRYKVQILDSLGGYLVVISDYGTLTAKRTPTVSMFAIDRPDHHHFALSEILGQLQAAVVESHG